MAWVVSGTWCSRYVNRVMLTKRHSAVVRGEYPTLLHIGCTAAMSTTPVAIDNLVIPPVRVGILSLNSRHIPVLAAYCNVYATR